MILENLQSRFAFAFPTAISQATQNARREAERRCRGVGRSAWMALRRVPTPRCRSEGTAAKRGPYASAEVLVTFGTKSDPAVRTEPDFTTPQMLLLHPDLFP